ncbi:UNVERIFIED_CONTAM: hypothetical protein K2H54_047283 [Gekko kuhli]
MDELGQIAVAELPGTSSNVADMEVPLDQEPEYRQAPESMEMSGRERLQPTSVCGMMRKKSCISEPQRENSSQSSLITPPVAGAEGESRQPHTQVRYVVEEVPDNWESEEEEAQDAQIPLIAALKKNRQFKVKWPQAEQIQHQKAELEVQEKVSAGAELEDEVSGVGCLKCHLRG